MNRKDFIVRTTGMLILGGLSVLGIAREPNEDKGNSKKYTVMEKRCDGCGHCFKACRDKALLVSSCGKAFIDQEKCKGCGDCLRFCRRMAIVEQKSN